MPLDALRMADVVGVLDGDEGSPHRVECSIESRGSTAIFLMAYAVEPRIAAITENLERPVGRTVVDEKDLEIPPALAQDALDGLAQVGARVVDRDGDADEGLFPRPDAPGAAGLSHRSAGPRCAPPGAGGS